MHRSSLRWPRSVFCALGLLSGACASADPRSTPSFCDVLPILQSKCQRCHQNPAQNGAPFALLTYADTQVAAPTPEKPQRKRYEQMRAAVESGVMPDRSQNLDPPVSDLTCEEKATLLAWLRAGAPPEADGENECRGRSSALLGCP